MQEEYVAKLKDFPFIEDVSKLKTVVDNVELSLKLLQKIFWRKLSVKTFTSLKLKLHH